MGFKRTLLPPAVPASEELTANMIGIGMLFGGAGLAAPNIEDTLLHASIAGMDGEDFRVLSVLCTWLDVHSRWVNADRLVALASAQQSKRVRAFWAAFGKWKKGDRRFIRLRTLHRGPRIDLLSAGQEFQLRRFGEDPRFAGGPLRVDARALRDRPADVLTPQELARRHPAYRWRVTIGPSYRADLWAALEANPSLSVSALARVAYASIGAAWEAKHDHQILEAAGARRS
jgi:hypothetical protein